MAGGDVALRVLDALDCEIIVRDAAGAVVLENASAKRRGTSSSPRAVLRTMKRSLPPLTGSAGAPDGVPTSTTALCTSASSRIAARGGPDSSGTCLHLEVRPSVAGDSAFLGVVLENMPQAAFSCNVDGSVDFLSTRARVLQSSPDPGARFGAGATSLLHPDDRKSHADAWAASLASGQPYKHEMRLLTPDGGFHWFEVCINPLRDERGRILKWLGTVTDRQEARRLIAAVEDERALLLTVLDQLPVGVMVADPVGALHVRNRRSQDIWQGVSPVIHSVAEYDQYVGFHADGRRYAAGDWPLARSLSSGEVVSNEDTVFQRRDGSRGVLRVSSAPVVNAAGDVVAGCVVMEDVSELRRMQEEHTRRLAAEEAAQAKRMLLTVVSHELR